MSKAPFHKVAFAFCLGGLKGLWKGICSQQDFFASMLETAVTPQLPKLKLPEKWAYPVPAGLKAFLTPGARPFKYRTVKKAEDIIGPTKVLQEKLAGVQMELIIGKDGKALKGFNPKGEKLDFLAVLPDLKDKVFDKSVWDSKIFMEVVHPKGENWVTGLFHSKPEKALADIKEHGHPSFAVLKVDKLGGFDVSTHRYADARPLAELVAGKIPHGTVPAQCDGTEAEKKAFIEGVKKENEGLHIQKCDGVVAYPKDHTLKNAKLDRLKYPMTGKFVIMGFRDSEKLKDSIASLKIGDGQKVLGKVNVADPGMRTTIRLNPDRYLNKTILIEYTRQTKKGGLVNPVWKKGPLFAESTPAVSKPQPEVKKAV